MKLSSYCSTALIAMATVLLLAPLGCAHAPGRPGPGPEVVRPEQVLDFQTLYKTNCAACHGVNGSGGPAIALSNPVYLAYAGEATLRDVTTKGVPHKLMPAFASSAGGMLTAQQVNVLVNGMLQQWGKHADFAGQAIPTYRPTQPGDPERGQQAFATFCASCHGTNGEGKSANSAGNSLGSIVDPAYLDLISDQALRSFIVAGRPTQGMPDWRSDSTVPMTDQQITDIVAWIVSKRTRNPGQPYPSQPHASLP